MDVVLQLEGTWDGTKTALVEFLDTLNSQLSKNVPLNLTFNIDRWADANPALTMATTALVKVYKVRPVLVG